MSELGMLRASAHFLALGLAVLPGCGCSDSSGNTHSSGHGGTGTGTGSDTGTGTETMATGGAGGGLPKPDPDGFEGWSPWPHTPEDCVLFVPDDLSIVEPPVFEPCPFMPDGCEMAGAPWAEEYDWGYGGLLSVEKSGSGHVLAVSKATVDNWWEIVVFRGDEVLGAWRYETEETGCRGGPTFSNGQAVFTLVRKYAYDEPWFFIAPPDEIFSNPGEPIVLDDNVVALGLSYVTDDILLVPENYNLFATRRVDGTLVWQFAPPEGFSALSNAVAFGKLVLSNAWSLPRSAVMLSNGTTGAMSPLLEEEDVTFHEIHTDGVDAAWIRGEGWQGIQGAYDDYSLWRANVQGLPESFAPAKVKDLDPIGLGADMVTVGEGWAAVYYGKDDVRLYRLSDGYERRLPKVPGFTWRGGPEHLQILDGDVWLQSGAGNDIRHIMRFEIEKLPTP